MNSGFHKDEADDGRLIDRLVDGELVGAERSELLARLDSVPGGWRRCALAFLEAQAWREAFGQAAAVAVPRPLDTGELPAPRVGRVRSLAAVAAGLVAAFALGWAGRGGPGPAPSPAPSGVVLAQSQGPAPGPDRSPISTPEPDRPDPAESGAEAASESAAVKAWESRGFQVERSRRFVSMELKDGRRLSVPLNEVRLKFVGGRTY